MAMAGHDRTTLTHELKKVAFINHVDIIGVADPKVFDDVPVEDRPRDILSDAKAVVVYAVRFEGASCLFEESWYKEMEKLLTRIDKKLREFLAEKGYKAHSFVTEVDFMEELQGLPPSERTHTLARQRQWRGVYYKLQDAAVAAGLGCIGKNRLLITPQHGPCAFLNMMVTDAPLVPDDPFDEDLCANCDLCLKACPTGAILKVNSVGHPDESLCKPRECHFACLRVCHEKFLKQRHQLADPKKST
jgi:epoxyqueuosine reductase QueG